VVWGQILVRHFFVDVPCLWCEHTGSTAKVAILMWQTSQIIYIYNICTTDKIPKDHLVLTNKMEYLAERDTMIHASFSTPSVKFQEKSSRCFMAFVYHSSMNGS
jgi:hypothetical protein